MSNVSVNIGRDKEMTDGPSAPISDTVFLSQNCICECNAIACHGKCNCADARFLDKRQYKIQYMHLAYVTLERVVIFYSQ